MKVIVTGSQGQLARALAETRLPRGTNLSFLGRTQIDLSERGSAAKAIAAARPDLVINAAAYTAVDMAESKRELAFSVNADGAGEVARAAREAGAAIIHLSTDYVFDGAASRPYPEDAPTAPINVYGSSKLEGERQVRNANPAHMIVRTSWVYSAFGANFVKTMLRLASEREEVRVVNDQLGRPTSAHDLAAALVQVVERWSAGDQVGQGCTYHVAGSGSCSWAEFATEVFSLSERYRGPVARVVPIESYQYPTPAPRPRYTVLDTTRFDRAFGLSLPDWRAALAPIVRRLVEP